MTIAFISLGIALFLLFIYLIQSIFIKIFKKNIESKIQFIVFCLIFLFVAVASFSIGIDLLITSHLKAFIPAILFILFAVYIFSYSKIALKEIMNNK